MPKIFVYRFRKYDIASDAYIESKRMATLPAIRRENADAILSTQKQVEQTELDWDGFHPPLNKPTNGA